VNTKSISLLSSDINNKTALSLLFDRQGHQLHYVNEGKISDYLSTRMHEMETSDLIFVDLDVGIGDTAMIAEKICSCNAKGEIVFLCDPVTAVTLTSKGIRERATILEKPVLPDELQALLGEGEPPLLRELKRTQE
jgi:two-component SAPR family response regulator